MPKAEVVVITGASAGVGRALARRFAKDGASIALLARGDEGLEAAAREVEALGGKALPIQVDVAEPDAVEAAAERIEQELGAIDIWINNAAVMLYGRVQKLSPDEIKRVSDVNYHGAVWGTQAALKRMRERNQGTIVQVGSGAAFRALPLMSSYSAAKHALRGFTESLRVELMHDNVDVQLTMVHPSSINTPLYTWARNHMPRHAKPIPPVYQPEVVAATIYWAAHARRRNVFVGAAAIATLIGDSLAPGLVDRLLAWKGFDAQMTDEPVREDRIDNLFEPVPGDFGAHGMFGERARSPALLTQLVARLGGGGIRAALLGAWSLMNEGE